MGEIRNIQDAALTYEGENWVLIQQTANVLLKIWDSYKNGLVIDLPLKSMNFLNDGDKIETWKFRSESVEELRQPHSNHYSIPFGIIIKTLFLVILDLFKWIIYYLLKDTYITHQTLPMVGISSLKIKNETQVFYAKRLSEAYIEVLKCN